jgi:hypothetical protein
MVCFENTILDQDLSIYEKMVYIVLCSHAKKDGPAFPSVMTIASEASCSRTKVFEALRVLEDRGVITRENRIFPKRGQTSNLYEIEDIEPRPQGEPGNCNPPPPSVLCTPASAERTGVVRDADAPLNVFELDPLNITKEQDTPPAPQIGGHTRNFQAVQIEPEPRVKKQEPMTERKEEEKTKPPGMVEMIITAYNAILPELPAAGQATSSREKAVKRRIREDPERSDPRWWEKYFSRVREFPWLMGSNPSGWTAAFDWLVGEKGMLKVLEGGFGRFVPALTDGAEIRSEAGDELQKKYTDANGVVDVRALLRELETA